MRKMNGDPSAHTPVLQRQLFINNEWHNGLSGKFITLVNPTTEVLFGSASSACDDDINAAFLYVCIFVP